MITQVMYQLTLSGRRALKEGKAGDGLIAALLKGIEQRGGMIKTTEAFSVAKSLTPSHIRLLPSNLATSTKEALSRGWIESLSMQYERRRPRTL